MTTVQVPDLSNMHESAAMTELNNSSLNGDFYGPNDFNPGVDVVKLQIPAPATDVESGSTVLVFMSKTPINVSDLRTMQFPHVEHYMPHGEDPIMAQLTIDVSKAMILELKTSRNVSIRVSPLLNEKPELNRQRIENRQAGANRLKAGEAKANANPA